MIHNMLVPMGSEAYQKGGTSTLASETALWNESSELDMFFPYDSIDSSSTITTSTFVRVSTNNSSDSDVSVSNQVAASKNIEDLVESKLSESTHKISKRRKVVSKTSHVVTHTYYDHSNAIVPRVVDILDVNKAKHSVQHRRGPRGGVATQFPIKLHYMMERAVDDGFDDIISWQPHGRCFILHKPKEFINKVMSVYFRQTRLTSFQRQLNLYGFRRLTAGRDKSSYYHELFLRGKPFLSLHMMRIRIKGTGIKAASSPETEPDFYSMPPIDRDGSACVSLQFTCPTTYLNPRSTVPSIVRWSNTNLLSQECKSQTAEQSTTSNADHDLYVLPTVEGEKAIPYKTPLLFASPMVSPFSRSKKCASLSSSAVLTDCDAVTSDNVVPADGVLLFEGKSFHYFDKPIVTSEHLNDALNIFLSLPEAELMLSLDDHPGTHCGFQEKQPNASVDSKKKEDIMNCFGFDNLESFPDSPVEPNFLDSFGTLLY